MTTIDISKSSIGVNCKGCNVLNILWDARNKEDVKMTEEFDGASKFIVTCPNCKKEDNYLLTDFIMVPAEN